MENEEDYMSYVKSVSLRPYKEEAWPCTCKNCEINREKLKYKDEEKIRVHIKKSTNKDDWTVYTSSDEFIPVEEFFKNRGEILLKEDSGMVEDFIPYP